MFPRTDPAIREAVRRWVLQTRNARAIMRKSGFRPSAGDPGRVRPILTLGGTVRVCFSPTGPIWAAYPVNFAIDAGKLYGWGSNSANRMGINLLNPPDYYDTPTALAPGLSDAVDVKLCGTFSAILRADGTVWRSFETNVDPDAPHTFEELEDSAGAVAIAAHPELVGSWDSLYVLKDDGTVWGMGNWMAGMGSGNFPYVPAYHWTSDIDVLTQMPTGKVSDVVRIQAFSIGSTSRLIFEKADGSVGTWQNQTEFPVYPTGLPADVIVKIRGSGSTAVILTDAGEIWATGGNGSGQYGNGTTSATSFASWHKADLDGWEDVGTTSNTVFGVRDGLLYSWGGDGLQAWALRDSTSTVPVDVSNGRDDWVKVWAHNSSPNPMASVAGGCVYTWGFQDFGQFGRGYTSLPFPIESLFEPKQVLFPEAYPPFAP